MLKVFSRCGPLLLLGMIAGALAVSPTAKAQTFSTATGATNNTGNPVSATATFTLNSVTDTIHIDLTNNIVNQNDVSQNISDLFFTLSGPARTGSLTGSSGNTEFVNADRTTTADKTNVSTGWVLDQTNSSTGLHLNGLAGSVNVPAYTILGKPDATGNYSNANGSIAGNSAHNPFLFGTVGFDISVAGLTADQTVTGIVFSFGTTAGNNVPANNVPEGNSLFLLAAGLMPVLGIGLRQIRRRKAGDTSA
jgi:hypothetical protein